MNKNDRHKTHLSRHRRGGGGMMNEMRTVKAYACRFRCGERVTTCAETILRHEQRCYKNPQNRACPACRHNKKEYGDYGGRYFVCKIDEKSDENNTFIKHCEMFQQPKEGGE